MRYARMLFGLVAFGLAPSSASGQSLESRVETLVREGDTVIGLGAMTGLTYVGINDSRTWMALLTTSFDDVARDGCILSNGFVTLREGTPLLSPAGSLLDEWNSISLNARGDLGQLIRVKPPTGPVLDVVYWNMIPVANKGKQINSPPLATAKWETFSVVKLNARNEMFILGEVTNPSRQRSLIRYQLDGAGAITGTTVLATLGMTIPAGIRLSGTTCLGTNEHIISVNDRGDVITFVAQDSLQALVINMETIVAQTQTPSPVGRLWTSFSNPSTRVAINDRGDYLIAGTAGPQTDPNSYLIVKNGQKFAQSNDILPNVSTTQPMGNGTPAPMYIANTGDVFWHVRVGTTAANQADSYMRNYDPIVVAGRTLVDNRLVTSVLAGENAFAISPNGRFWIGNVMLQSVGSAVAFADFGLVLEQPGCSGNRGKLTKASGEARVGKELQLAMNNGQAPGAAVGVFFSEGSLLSPDGCGVRVKPFGEFMIGPRIAADRTLTPWDGTNPSTTTLRIPDRISLVDAVFYAQGLFFSPGHPTERVRLTNALRIEIGAP